jgi:hypothetical protein
MSAESYNEDIIDLSSCAIRDEMKKVFASIKADFGLGPLIINANWRGESQNSNSKTRGIIESTTKQSRRIIVKVLKDHNDHMEDGFITKRPYLEIEIIDINNQYLHPEVVIEMYLTFVFTAVNLSSPGSMNLSGHISDWQRLRYHADFLGCGWRQSIRIGWPPLKKINLKDSVRWLLRNEIFKRQIAHSRTQRIIYSLLHICNGEGYGLLEILWLSQALEALVDSPSDKILKYIQERLFLILGYPKKDINGISRKIRDVYDMRSRIVHGNFDIYHPAFDESLDKEVRSYITNKFVPVDFSAAIVISALQKMICNNCVEFTFQEKVKGVRKCREIELR